jgi:HlyD family secretion protein
MKKLLISIVIFAGILAGGGFWYQRTLNSNEEMSFQLAEITRGDLENIVSSTGTLSAVGTVEVGSQISGIVETVYVDYNDKIKKGQILARVDTTLLKASVRDAEANLAKSRAQLHQAQTEYQRNEKLFQAGYISEMTFLSVKTSVETAKASVQSAESALQRAQTNLKYAEIHSPITGTVIERTVEAGQTISASTSAPTLFTIAEDLAQMQIEASVDESDIGQIKQNMSVRFTVQAYPDELFTGTVRQVRLKPTVSQDVVNYTVVVDAPNERDLLLPGMTATVDFLVDERKDVLLIPNTALYFKPPEEMLAQIRENIPQNPANNQQADEQASEDQRFDQQQADQQRSDRQQSGENRPRRQQPDERRPDRQPPDGQRPDRQQPNRQPPDGRNPGRQRPDTNRSADIGTVFYLAEEGTPTMARFMKGITNGIMTEVRRSRDLKEGMQVITGVNKQESSRPGFSLPFFGGGGRRGLRF